MNRIRLWLCILILAFATIAYAAAPVLTDSSAYVDNNNNQATWTQSTTLSSGLTWLIVKHAEFDRDDNISGITWNGSAMTELTLASDSSHNVVENCSIWGLQNPTSGTHNIVVSYSPNRQYEGGLIVEGWSNVSAIGNTNPPNASGNAGFNSSDTSPLLTTITMTSGSVATDCGMLGGGSPAVAGGQTQVSVQSVGGGGDVQVASYLLDATQMQWTFSGTQRTAHAVVELKATGGGGGGGGSACGRMALLGVGCR